MKEDIKKFVRVVCEDLSITPPKLKTRHLEGSMMAKCKSDGSEIIVQDSTLSPDLYFAIAHELRHIWQIRNRELLLDYKEADKLSVEEYNLQPAEIDAHAYSAVVMKELFGIRPLWNGLSATIVEKIEQRMADILASSRKEEK